MKPRLINANALMDYCQNQMAKKIDCNDIARFPTYPTDKWHKVADRDLPKFDEGTEIKYLRSRYLRAKKIVICLCDDSFQNARFFIELPELPKEIKEK